jgi:hypothetical protein
MKNNNINLGHTQVIPLNDDKNIIPLIDQLNGLLDRYNALFELYTKYLVQPRLAGVLFNLEQAIEAICQRIDNGIIKIKE